MEKSKKVKFINKPEYVGGPKALTAFIYSHLQYPAAALAAGVEGTVIVEYDIDYRGTVVATRVLQGLGHGCDEEACRVVSMLQFEVAKNRGLRVLFHQKANIRFAKPKPVPIPEAAAQQNLTLTYTMTVNTENQPSVEPMEQQSSGTYTYTIKF